MRAWPDGCDSVTRGGPTPPRAAVGGGRRGAGADCRGRHQGEQTGAAAGPGQERGINHREVGLHRASLSTCSM